MIKILCFGDIMGKPGRQALTRALQRAREELQPDIVLINGENAAGGFGITEKIYHQFVDTLGISCITTGNHWHDKREIINFLPQADRMVVPANMMNVENIHKGFALLETPGGLPYAVINLIGKSFMHPDNRNPFHAAEQILKHIPERVKIRIVDMHAEATSEKQGMGQFLTGRVSLVYGTHSHVPTADERILPEGTGFITDIGMTGPYDSVIGIRKDAALHRMVTGEKKNFEPAVHNLWATFILAQVDPQTGRCHQLDRFRWELPQIP